MANSADGLRRFAANPSYVLMIAKGARSSQAAPPTPDPSPPLASLAGGGERDSELLEQRVGARKVRLAGRFLDVERLDHAVVDHHRVTLRAQAEAVARSVEGHVERLGEIAIAVRQEL